MSTSSSTPGAENHAPPFSTLRRRMMATFTLLYAAASGLVLLALLWGSVACAVWLTVAGALLMLAAAALMANRIARPIAGLSRTARQVEAGELSARAAPTGSAETVGLARAFNSMLARLQQTQRQLEARVDERTAELRAAVAELRRLNRAVHILSACSKAIRQATKEDELLERVCCSIVAAQAYPMAWVGLAEQDQRRSVRVAARAGDDGGLKGTLVTWADDEYGRGVTGTAIRTGQVQTCRDLFGGPQLAAGPDGAPRGAARSAIALPLKARDQVFGALSVYAAEPDAFDEDEVRLLADLAADLSRAVMALREGQQREKAEAERKELEAQFRQAQKLESIGRLAGGMAHDLNNLLMPIIGYAELGMRQALENSPLRASLAQIHLAGNRARDLTRRLLAFSRKQILDMRAVNLNHVLAELEPMLRRLIREDIVVKLKLDPKLGSVRADAGQLQQVVINLAVNAQDAMPAGGRLLVETRNAVLDEAFALCHAGIAAGPYVLLSVQDTGSGMSPEVMAHLFEPFFTTKRRDQGTGLGLPTVHGIVRQHGGHIFAHSELGRGTQFHIYLPRVEAAPERPAPAPEPAPAHRGHQTILVVEDNDMVRELLCEVLAAHGYTVLSASGAAEAMSRAAQAAGPLDLLLTDVVMPGQTGPQLHQRLTQSRPGLKVLYMSGYMQDSLAQADLPGGMKQLLAKPFSIDQLLEKVHTTLK